MVETTDNPQAPISTTLFTIAQRRAAALQARPQLPQHHHQQQQPSPNDDLPPYDPGLTAAAQEYPQLGDLEVHFERQTERLILKMTSLIIINVLTRDGNPMFFTHGGSSSQGE
ncbi:hypothetical protein TSUD_242530 [Trifolium subterraneum]|uniref:Uncharacterized protein n=1 Tax=Trifolium subterraneum TaxID=3900 RepID=A0A2Z6LRH4_TRISU|nr:hypothetical protein TSUD_242530 [Trifolium subterraneum]